MNSIEITHCRVLRKYHRRLGAFTVEFAICSGLFFTILLAGFEFARFMYARHSVEQAAYESARVGIVPGKTVDDVTAKANQFLNATGVRNATITVTPTTFTTSTSTVTVEIQCKYSDNSWLKPIFLADKDMLSSMTLDHENKAYLLAAGTVGNNSNEPIDQ
ncbi:MAG: pilus assembly protein [Planctomycetota bacterium]|nr:pilus assembly protein [Planctomycetota bacterium]